MAMPKLRFKDDSGKEYSDWNLTPLHLVFQEIVEKGRTDLPVLSIKQGFGTVLRDGSDRNIIYEKANLKNYKAMQVGDFIIHLRSFEGGLECSRYNGISSPAYHILRSNIIVSEAYREYFRGYEFIQHKLAQAVVGIRDGKNIDMETFWNIEIPIASLEEQQKIADFLTTVDEKLSIAEAKLEKLEVIKKGFMQKIFSQEFRFKADDGSEYPEWEEKVLKNIVKSFSGGTPKSTSQEYYGGKIPFIRSGEIHSNNTAMFLTEEGLNNSSAKMVGVGDVLYALYGANSGDVSISKICGAINQAILCIRPCQDVSPVFLMELLDYAKSYIINTYLQGGQGNLSAQIVLNLSFIIPSLPEQQKIADFFTALDRKIELQRKRVEDWKVIKKGLLQQMFC